MPEHCVFGPYSMLFDLQPLLCLPACRGVQQVRGLRGHQELQGRQQDQCYLSLPTGGHMVMTQGNDRRFLSNCVMCWISFRLTLTPVAPSLPGGPSDPGVP